MTDQQYGPWQTLSRGALSVAALVESLNDVLSKLHEAGGELKDVHYSTTDTDTFGNPSFMFYAVVLYRLPAESGKIDTDQ